MNASLPLKGRADFAGYLKPLAWWLIPVLFLFCLYQGNFRIWFREDDFSLVTLAREVHSFRGALAMMFSPYAQGTIRPWSERLPFLLSLKLFGTNCVPFRIAVFATAAADILLITYVVRRVTGSRIAGLAAPCFWVASASLISPMTWNSSYNEVQFPLFLLGALACFIRYAETGQKRFWWLQLAVFVLGFGSLENNVVYPAVAAAWALFAAPPHKRNKLLAAITPLAGISALYFWIHLKIAPLPAGGIYAVHLDRRIVSTAWEYWRWAFLSPGWAAYGHSAALGKAILIVAMSALVLFCVWQISRRQYAALFFLAWFGLTIAPLLLLPDRHSEYYLAVPVIGLVMLAGWGVSLAWKKGWLWRAAALAPVLLWGAGMLPVVQAGTRKYVEESKISRNLVLGVRAVREAHPRKPILIDGITPDLYRIAILESAFHAVGAEDVYLTPGAEATAHPFPDDERFTAMTLDPAVAFRAVAHGGALVYSFYNSQLHGITALYAARSLLDPGIAPRRVEVGSRLYSYLLGPEWLNLEGGARWMPGAASLRLAGPSAAGEGLLLNGYCSDAQLKRGPLRISVSADGFPVGSSILRGPDTHFHLFFKLPSALIGRRLMAVKITADPPIRLNGQDYGLIFGSIALAQPAP